MSEWQPIETAPKDGTEVFIWIPDRNDFMRSRFHTWWLNKYGNGPEYQWGKTKLHESGMQVVDYQVIEPTHWMPLPSPPILRVEGETQ